MTDADSPAAGKPPARDVSLLALPPRPVPLSLRLQVLFGGPTQQFGWIFFGFGLVFFWVFALNSDISSFVRLIVPQTSAPGSVTAVESTNASENDSPVYRVSYQFVAPDGSTHTGTSYTTGFVYEAGDRVTVEFALRHPEDSNLRGARRAMFGPAALFVVIFPAVGLAFVVIGMWDGLKANQLLRSGRLALARLRSAEGTNASVNNRPVIKLIFEFVAHDGTPHAVTIRTSLPEALEDEAEEIVLYDAGDPDYAVMLDGLPGPPRLTAQGELEPASFLRAAGASFIPLLTIFGHGLYLLSRVLR